MTGRRPASDEAVSGLSGEIYPGLSEAHAGPSQGEQFALMKGSPVETLQVLARLDQLEMISSPTTGVSVDRSLAAVLQRKCNGPSPESLQSNPRCPADFPW